MQKITIGKIGEGQVGEMAHTGNQMHRAYMWVALTEVQPRATFTMFRGLSL